ncbi:MAG: TspO/MBR family protein [Pseudomonadota bacterium]
MEGGVRKPLAVAIAAALVVSFAGGALTDVGPWYENLKKPSFNPPNWVFAPAWTTIYSLCVVAAVVGWRAARTGAQRTQLIALFGLNAFFNVCWSALFFAIKRPDWALGEIVFLWLSVLALVLFFLRFSKISALALTPYLLWVAFAAVLNLTIVQLNAPFG